MPVGEDKDREIDIDKDQVALGLRDFLFLLVISACSHILCSQWGVC